MTHVTRMTNGRVYLREVDGARQAVPQARSAASTATSSFGFWSKDGNTIYFNEGMQGDEPAVRARRRRRTTSASSRNEQGVAVGQQATTTAASLLINYADRRRRRRSSRSPSIDQIANRSRVDAAHRCESAGARASRSARQEEITWKSTDGTMVGGVLVKPVGYQAGKRYPLIVAIHGGPAAADVLGFNGGYGSQVYAGAGYVVLLPELPRLHELRREAQDRDRRRLLHEGL